MLFWLLSCISRAAVSATTICPHPFIPQNGHVVFDAPAPYFLNTVAKYSCAPEFEKVGGTDERVCSSTGSWSGEAPVCAIDVAAGKPAFQSSGTSFYFPSRGLCTVTDNTTGSWWEVDLLSPYSLHGVAIRLGKLTSSILNVYLIQENGDLHVCDTSGYSFLENTTVYLHCELDEVEKVRIVAEHRLHLCEARIYAVNAVSSWQCSQGTMDVLGVFDGLCYSASKEERADWQGAQRRCLDRGATLPMKITDTAQRGLKAALKTSTQQKDFYWIGVTSSLTNWRWADGTVVSDEEADWSGSPIQPANRPEAIVMARVADWKWIPSAQNVWNSFLCQSRPKSCTFPGISEAGRVSFTSPNFAIGTRAVYSCETGYELKGDVERHCDETARWSGTIPECQKKKCDSMEVWRGGGIVRLLNETAEFGNEIQYECLNGWKLIGEERRRCMHDGTWSGVAPYCKVVDCEAPPSIPNGRVSVSTTTFDSQANYSCMEGYRLIGHDKVTCAAKGMWEPAVPVCYDIATLRELRANSTESHAGLAALGVVLAFILVFVVFRFSKTTKTVPISEKPPPPSSTPSNLIYVTPSMLTNPQDSVVYYASSNMPFTKMEIPPHLLSLKHLPNGNIEATLPIGRQFVRPQLPVFSSSPTPSQLLYTFDYEPIYDFPPDVQRRPEADHEENIYEKLADVKPDP